MLYSRTLRGMEILNKGISTYSECQVVEAVTTNRSLLQRAEKYNWSMDFVW